MKQFLSCTYVKTVYPGVKVCFLTAMYREQIREVEHCALNKDQFLQKPISNEDLIMEINKKIGLT
jgi:two-component SAPR family response regulator